MKIVYGPIASWRLGKSLGIDLLCTKNRTCSFDCNYCQLQNKNETTIQKKDFINIDKLKQELETALKQKDPDVITFSGMGEPTLAKNMKDAIELIRTLTNHPIAILTNSSLLYDKDVQKILKNIDIIVAKLDAPNQKLFTKINQPSQEISFEQTIKGIKTMRKKFPGKFALQIMFMKENKNYAHDLAELSLEINPDEVQINTPLRNCDIKPLNENELNEVEKKFKNLNIISVYRNKKPKTNPLDMQELIKRNRTEP